MDFKCYNCELVFEAEGYKKDYIDPMYGPCSKIVAECQTCKGEATEYRAPKPGKASSGGDIAACGMTPSQAGCGCCSN